MKSAGELQRKLELVVETGLLLTKTMDIQTMVQAATDAGLQLCEAQFGAFFYNVVDASGQSYLLYTLSGASRDKFEQFPMPRNTSVFAPTFEGIGIVRSGDITKDLRYGKNAPLHGMPEGHLPVRSYLAVPVKAQSGEVLGGLFYGHDDTDVFEQGDEDLVLMVAAQAATAIENFRLREQLTRKMEALEKAEAFEQEAMRHLAELAAIVESSDDAIISKDLNGIIRSWNGAAARIFGYTREEIVGKSILTLIPTDLHEEEKMILNKIRRGEHIDHYETIRLSKSGERLEVSLSISPIFGATGTIIGASKILRNISERKRIENTVLQAEKVAAAGRMAATIAHEINNPLEAVVNLLFLARLNLHDAAQADTLLETAEGEIARVSHIARQTLGFYRESGSASLTSVSNLVTEAVQVYRPKCAASGIEIQLDLRSDQKIFLRKGEIMQVISNLAANAIYAMPSGGILSLSVEDTGLPAKGVRFTIKDTGVGIPKDRLPRIFEAFYSTRGSLGTGIGLFVAKQLIEGHGGMIEVESDISPLKHGTTLTIFLPHDQAAVQKPGREQLLSRTA